MASKPYFFRCKSNPDAPLLKLETFWESQEMIDHPDYERVDEFGEVVVDERDTAEHQIPIGMAAGN